MQFLSSDRRSNAVWRPSGIIALLFFLFMAVIRPIHADLIHLRNGKVIEGIFDSQKGNILVFNTYDGKKEIPANLISKMELGYTGVPACYKLHEDFFLSCDALLHMADTKEALIVPHRGSMVRKKIPWEKIKFLEFQKEKQDQRVISLLSRGLKLSVTLDKGQKFEGTIVAVRASYLSLKQSDGKIKKLSEKELKRGVISPITKEKGEQKVPHQFRVIKIFPGFLQIKDGRWITGFSILGMILGASAYGYSEYQQANNVSRRASSDPLYIPGLTDGKYIAEFNRHQNAQRVAAAVGGVAYLYHLYDIRIWDFSPVATPDKPGYDSTDLERKSSVFIAFRNGSDSGVEQKQTHLIVRPGHYWGVSLEFRF